MAILFLEDGILEDVSKWGQNKETFIAAINKHIETHYKGEDSEAVYALFNDTQRKLLDTYFRGFSIELYKELNGTVELQIQKKSMKVKEKINKIAEFMGPINLEDWVYDGMIDGGKNNSQKCDLCPRPVRYAHFAVNQKTHECLRFGCNCAADFFNMDKGSLQSMRTIQAQTLKDIKMIACVVEMNNYEDYYTYMGGYTGKVILEEGGAGLKNLMTFMVKWDKSGELVLDPNSGDCIVEFGDGSKGVKPLYWVKQHIVSCLNADLDKDIYNPLEKRIVMRKTVKKEDKSQMNTVGYVKYALKFIELGLPVPVSLMKKLNTIISKANKQSHPDYIKYAQELLISHNLEKSAFLKKAFTDFIVNYLASSMGIENRDPELEYWGIRGQKTFYNTVLTWETAMVKLMYLKEFYSLVSQGYISQEEFDKYLRARGYVGIYTSSKSIKDFMNRCQAMFLVSSKEVEKNPNMDVVLKEGYSKYTLKGLDDRLSLCLRNRDGSPVSDNDKLAKVGKGFNSGMFTPETIPVDIGLHYYAMQQSYQAIVKDSIVPVLYFLKYLNYCSGTKETVRYLCALAKDSTYGSMHCSQIWKNYYVKNKDDFKRELENFKVDEDFYKEMYQKYKDLIPQFKKEAAALEGILLLLHSNLQKPIIAVPAGKKLTASNINSDYEDLIVKQEKTNKDYFKDYCELLIAKRGNKKILININQKNLFALTVYKQLESYAGMLEDIQNSYINSFQNAEEKKLYSYLNLGVLKETLMKYLDTPDIDTFIKLIAFEVYKDLDIPISFNTDSSLISYINVELNKYDKPLQEKAVIEKLDECLKKEILDNCIENRVVFNDLYNKLKELFIVLKKKKEYIKFTDFYALLEDNFPEVDEYLKGKDLISCEVFEKKINNALDMKYQYTNKKIKFEDSDHASYAIRKLLPYLKNYKGMREDIDKIKELVQDGYNKHREEQNRIERENRVKGPVLDELRKHLKEHIAFFEVNVDKERKNYPKTYGKLSDVTIRQKVAFNSVVFQKGYEESMRFIEELEKLGSSNWNAGVSDVIASYKGLDKLEYGKQKACSEALRAEMYNHKLIYNHFDITYKALKDLDNMDLKQLTIFEINDLAQIMKYYYIFKSQVEYIKDILEKYNALTFDYNSELSKLPEPTIKDINEVLDKFTDKADSTGFTGLEKAEKVKAHADFGTLPDYLQSIVSTVCKFKRCSEKQLKHVNTAFTQLGLGQPDKVDEVSDSSVDENSYTELAKQIIAHPDVKFVPELSLKIATTVSKTGRCSDKQAKHLEKAKKILGL